MYEDVFEDNKSCSLQDKNFEHGSESCDADGLKCKVCINGRWADKVRSGS